jgi:lipase chaperone LimK
LRGTDVDSSLMLGADGHFVPTADALALFDYFLAASGEEPLAVIRQRILDAIYEQLPSTAAAEATALLDTYLGYREALRTLAEAGDAPADLERRLQWLRELRRAHFGGQSELLFAESEATSRIDLERRRVALNPELSEEERAARLAALEEQLPERVRTSRQRARAPAELRAEVAGIRASGGSEAEVFAAREARFGAEAAQRLAAEDVRRQRWRDRLVRYGAERDALSAELAREGAPPDAIDEALEALRRTHFEEDELRRVRALDGAL